MSSILTFPGLATEPSQFACPVAAQGQTTNALGDYDQSSVSSAVHASAAVWGLALIMLVCVCYNWTRLSMSPRFVFRWWIFLAIGAVVGAIAVYATLSWWPTIALANSCQSDPRAFPIALPSGFVWTQVWAAMIYGALMFAVLSVVFTAILGRFAHQANGFFHNRGCPLPRALP
ncbi:MAG: hypothetical protein ABJE47_11825 [bacterium]